MDVEGKDRISNSVACYTLGSSQCFNSNRIVVKEDKYMSGAIAYLGFIGIMFVIAMGLFFGLKFAKVI